MNSCHGDGIHMRLNQTYGMPSRLLWQRSKASIPFIGEFAACGTQWRPVCLFSHFATLLLVLGSLRRSGAAELEGLQLN